MSKSKGKLSIVRRVEADRPQGKQPIDQVEAFRQVHGPKTYQLHRGRLVSRQTDEAATRAAACITACEGLPLLGLQEGGLRQVIEAARAAERLLAGRLVHIDPEASLVRDQLRKAMRKLAIH